MYNNYIDCVGNYLFIFLMNIGDVNLIKGKFFRSK